jgi:hypothetical protein
MFRVRIVAVASLLVLSSYPLCADVRADQKTRVEFAGMLGRMMNLFGGKGAKEGTVSTVAVKGDRKATLGETSGQIVDLAEEKVYDLDIRKKSYKVTTFAELRRRMEEAKKKAEDDAKRADQKKDQAPAETNVEIDFDVKDTGQKKTVNGFDTHQVVMTIALREKGKALEQGGGMVLTSDLWLAPAIAAMREIAAFDQRYFEKLYGPMIAGASAEEMAAAMAIYPLLAPAMKRMRTESAKMNGTAILTTTTFESVKSAEQMASEQNAKSEGDSKPSGVGGLVGGLARRAAQKKGDNEPKPRTTVMTSTNEVLKVVADVTPADVAIPAGFKENK